MVYILWIRPEFEQAEDIDDVVPEEQDDEARHVEVQHPLLEGARILKERAMQEPYEDDDRLDIMVAVDPKEGHQSADPDH